MTATLDIWIRTLLAATAVVVLAVAPAVVPTAEPDDPSSTAPQLEQSSPDERTSRPRPSRSARRDTQRVVSSSAPIDPDVLVPPLRPTTEAEGEVAPERDGDGPGTIGEPAARAETNPGPPGEAGGTAGSNQTDEPRDRGATTTTTG